MFDPSKMQDMMRQAQQLQTQMQENLKNRSVEGQAGGGLVTVTLNGLYEMTSLTIDPRAAGDADKTLLEDLVRAAYHAALEKVEAVRVEAARGMAGNFGLPPGMF
jgi:DNA-binding YbaB/EbfC family protein